MVYLRVTWLVVGGRMADDGGMADGGGMADDDELRWLALVVS